MATDKTTQKEYLQDLILEMMETNQNLVTIDTSVKMNSDYLNNINANSWASFEQLNIIANIMKDNNSDALVRAKEDRGMQEKLLGALTGNNLAALEKAKEDGAMQERMLNALEGINDNTKAKPKAKELDLNFGPAGILGGIAAFVAGFIKGYLKQFTTVAKAFYNIVKAGFGVLKTWIIATFKWVGETKFGELIKKKFNSIVTGVAKWFDNIADFFKGVSKEGSVLGKIKSFFTNIGAGFVKVIDGWKDEFALWKKYVGPVVTKIKSLLAPMLDLGARFDDIKGFFTVIKNTVSGWVTNVFSKVKDVLGMLGGGDSILGKIGKFFGKFLAPVTFLFTLYDTVKGAIDGYENGGILGAVKGALGGFLASLVAEPLNMLKNLVSWVAEKMGFEGFSKALDGFDFVALFTNGINGIFNWVSKLFTDPGAALSELWNNLVGAGGLMDLLFKPIDMMIDWVTKKFGFRSEDAPEFSLGNVIRSIWNTIIDWVAAMVETIPIVGGRGAAAVRSLKAETATVDIKKMATAPPVKDTKKDVVAEAAKDTAIISGVGPMPEKVENNTGQTLKNSATEKANTNTVAEAARDSAIMSGVGSTGSGGGGGSTSISASNSQSTINISSGHMADRTDMSIMTGSFGISP